MLTAILIVATVLFWSSFIALYFRTELTRWFDNRFGPDHKPEKAPDTKKKFWQIYD